MAQSFDQDFIVALELPVCLRTVRRRSRVLSFEVEAQLLEQLIGQPGIELRSIVGRKM